MIEPPTRRLTLLVAAAGSTGNVDCRTCELNDHMFRDEGRKVHCGGITQCGISTPDPATRSARMIIAIGQLRKVTL